MPRTEEVAITAGTATLRGTLTLPDRSVPEGGRGHPALLLLASWLPRDRHGRYDRRRHRGWFVDPGPARHGLLSRLAGALADAGVASLAYDKRGCGQSDGSWSEAGLFTLVDDARDALAVLRGHPAIDAARIGILGHGEGAGAAFSVAAADPAVGPLTVVGAPARALRDVLRRGVAERARRAAAGVPGPRHPFVTALDRGLEELLERAPRGEPTMTLHLPGGRRTTLALPPWEQALRVSNRALATLQRRSVTMVHGIADEWVDPDESELLAAALAGSGAPRRLLVPGAGHDLAEAGESTLEEVSADLRARLQPRRLPTVLVAIEDPVPLR